MANLVELSNQLEYVPQEQLVQMSQDPNSMFPSFLVLSEIQRRNQMKKMYEAQQPKPQTTVAEEVVQEFAGQQGLQGAMAQSPGPQNAFQPGDMGNMAPPSPMQGMAAGGVTGYKNKGKTEYKEAADNYGKQLQEIFEKEGRYKKRYSDYEKGERFTYPLTPRDYVVSDEEYSRLKEGDYVMGEGALQEYRPFLMLLNALDGESGARYMPESEVKGLKAKLKASIIEDKLSQMGMASGGRTGYQAGGSLGLGGDSLAGTFTNPMENQINESSGLNLFGEDGLIFDPNNPLDYLVFVPGLGLVSKGLSSLYKGSKLLSKTAKSKIGQQAVKTDPRKRFGTPDERGLRPLRRNEEIGGEVISDVMRPITSRPYTSTAVGLYGTSKIADAVSGDEQIIDVEPNVIENPATVRTPQESAKEIVSEDIETGKKGLGQKFDADMLVALGGAIGSAKNLGELSSGISKAYFDVKSSRDAKDLAGLQGRLIEAQISKYEADVANMPLDVAIKQYQSLNDLVDSGVLTPEEAKIREAALMQRIQQLQSETGTGFAVSEAPTGGDILARNRVA